MYFHLQSGNSKKQTDALPTKSMNNSQLQASTVNMPLETRLQNVGLLIL